MKFSQWTLAHRAFQVGVVLKGLDSLIEVIGGIALLVTIKPEIEQLVRLLTRDELSEDPDDLVANSLIRISRRLSVQSQHFAGCYLIGHGAIKLGLAIGLLRGVHWAYPAALIILTLFIVYQFYRITYTHSLMLLLFTLLDVVIVLLIFREWRSTKPQA